ncbi:MAG: hypothetical protein K2X69_09065 [Silvanigrellaceae bacterium]|nr:hypothetical protein [Silvanigrellaceae bacterium]
MKKRIFAFVFVTSLLAASCSKNSSSNSSNGNNGGSSVSDQKPTPSPINPIDPTPEPEKPKILKLNFGSDGIVTLNNETGEYKIDRVPTSKPDFNFMQPSKGLFDSFIPDPEYIYRSSLFPVDKYSLFKIPEILEFDPVNSIGGTPSDGKYDVDLEFWGSQGKFGKGYLACYKSVNNQYAKLDFIVDGYDLNVNKLGCSKLKELIDKKQINTIDIKGGDYLLLRFYGFRMYSHGECENPTHCVVSYNSPIIYYIKN